MMNMKTFRDALDEQLKDEEFKKEYDALKPEFELIKAMVDAREELGITQTELSERTGIQQANISRIENGSYNPSLQLLKRIATGLNKELHIEFR
jgi:DNA-binding XRE family transcriptional regulator